MTDTNKLKQMANDSITHKKYVLDTCYLMFKYLTDNGKIQLGINLLKRAASHDNSKFNEDEFNSLASIMESDKCFKDASAKLSDKEIKAISVHWKKNRHHPEYFDNYDDMSELDIIEMVCDWFARSLQHGTEFIPFVIERQRNRFHFSEEKFKIILGYCKLIEKLYRIENKN